MAEKKMISPEVEKNLRKFLKAEDLPDSQWRLFVEFCNRYHLDPLNHEVYITKGQIGLQIDGWRKVAQREDPNFAGVSTFQIRQEDKFSMEGEKSFSFTPSFLPKSKNPIVAAFACLKRVGKPDLYGLAYMDEWAKAYGLWGGIGGVMLEYKAERCLIKKCYNIKPPEGFTFEGDQEEEEVNPLIKKELIDMATARGLIVSKGKSFDVSGLIDKIYSSLNRKVSSPAELSEKEMLRVIEKIKEENAIDFGDNEAEIQG